nr:unnamed protein product [Callosobruchus chinensis]
MWKILCAESAGRQLKLRNTSSSIVLRCAEEEARIWKLSRRKEDKEYLKHAPCMQKVEKQNAICFKRYTTAMHEIQSKTPASEVSQAEPDIINLMKKKREAADEGIKNVCWHLYGIDETPVLPYAPGDIESIVENERCRIYWNYSFPTLVVVQTNKSDVFLLDHQQKTMFIIEFAAPAEVNIASEEEKRTKYQEILGQLCSL